MYQQHFGLKKPLFESGIAHDAAVFLGRKHELAIASLKVALTPLDSAVVLTGTAGVGKTTLISSALRGASTRLALGWVTGTPMNGAELLELLLVELGFNAHRVGRVERMQMWRQFRSEMRATDSRLYVIVERADDMTTEVLRALDSLTTAEASGIPGANLVLLGETRLLDLLKAPPLASLRQRVRLRERLEPLTADELERYLAHHAALAGGELANLFAPNAIAKLHELTDGIPRLVNNVCETALAATASANGGPLTPERLADAARTMFGTEDAREPAESKSHARETTASKSTPAPEGPSAPEVTAPASATRSAARAVDAVAAPAVSLAFAAMPTVTFGPVPPAHSPPAYSPPTPPTPPGTPTASEATAPQAERRARLVAAAPQPKPRPPERAPVASAARSAFPPATEARAASANAAPAAPPVPEIDSFADTLTDTPDVQMIELPVLTDAIDEIDEVDAPVVRRREVAELAYARTARAPAASPPRPALAEPSSRAVEPPAPAHAPATPDAAPRPEPAAAAALPAAAPQSTRDHEPSEEDLLHQTQTMRALAAAKSIDDVSSSMAETLFGEADLDMFSAALGAAGWSDDSAATTAAADPHEVPEPSPAPAQTSAAAKVDSTPVVEDDPFDFFGLGPDLPLELIDDSSESGRRKAARSG